MIGIYKITSPSGRIYIGQSWDIDRRLSQYRGLEKSTIGKLLFNSLTRHGFENHTFDIIEEIPEGYDQDYLDEWERLYIWQFKSNYSRYPECNGLNLTDGGGGFRSKHTEQTKAKMSETRKGKPGRTASEDTRKKLRESHLGLKGNRSRKIIQYDSDMNRLNEFESAKEAAEVLKVGRTSIKNNLRNYSNSAGGFIFKYFSNN